MKLIGLLTMGVLISTSVRAAWQDLREGLAPDAARAAVGAPLLVSRSRTGVHVTWTYDSGAYIIFEQGRVRYWQKPKSHR